MVDIIDGFGKVYMAYYSGEPSNHVTERDDGFIRETPDAHYYFRTYEEWPEYEREAMLEAKGKVLDVGLGAGRHSLWLQKKGMDVVGIDNSPLAIKVSKLRGVKDCRLMDIMELDFPEGTFNTVLMLGANLGLGDVEDVRRILSKLHEITAPDGIIIGHTRDPLKTDNPSHLGYHEMNRKRNKPPGLVKVRIGFQGEYGEWFDLLLMQEALLVEILEPTRWELSKIYWSENSDYIAILSKRS